MYGRNNGPKNIQKKTVLSKPITIPSKKNDNEYSFKLNTFDPMNSSPPNSWNNRLITRINCYDDTH